MAKQAINPDNVFTPDFFSQAIKVGNTLYLSGQVAYDLEHNIVGKGDIAAQAKQLFENMKRVLESAGATMADVVKTTYYLKNYDDLQNIAEPFLEYFQPPYPASVGVQVSRLAETDLLIEVDAIAVID